MGVHLGRRDRSRQLAMLDMLQKTRSPELQALRYELFASLVRIHEAVAFRKLKRHQDDMRNWWNQKDLARLIERTGLKADVRYARPAAGTSRTRHSDAFRLLEEIKVAWSVENGTVRPLPWSNALQYWQKRLRKKP